MANKNQVLEFIEDLQTAYDYEPKNAKAAAAIVRAWVKGLAGVDADLDTVYEQIIATHKWFPRLPEVLQAVREVDNNNGRSVITPAPAGSDYWSAMSIIKGGLKGVIPAEAAHTDKRVAGVLKMSRREWSSEQG